MQPVFAAPEAEIKSLSINNGAPGLYTTGVCVILSKSNI